MISTGISMPDPAEAPGDLELVRLFLNTADLEEGKDDLASPAALREAIRGLALANNGGQAYPVDLATLNRAATECGLRPRFGPGGSARLEPEAGGLERSLGRLVAAVHEAMATRTWPRLKACGRHSCRWAFYDSSRNQSRTWCSMATCGNRTKAQRFRSRTVHS